MKEYTKVQSCTSIEVMTMFYARLFKHVVISFFLSTITLFSLCPILINQCLV